MSFCAEYTVVLYFFSPLKDRQEKSCWLGYLCLASVAVLYFLPEARASAAEDYSTINLLIQGVRLALYWIAVAGCLWFVKDVSPAVCIYLAAFYTPFYAAARGLNAMLRYVQLNMSVFGKNPDFHRLWMAVAVLVLEFFAAFLVHRLLWLEQIQKIGKDRIGLVLLVNFLMLYFKYSGITLQTAEGQIFRLGDAIFYPMCAMIGILVMLILFESLQASQAARYALEMDQLMQGYELQSVKRAMQFQNDINRIHHDMKNHLLAIRDLGQQRVEVSTYVDALLDDMAGYETIVSTGLPAMDAFLSEKLYRAQLEQIQYNVCLDLSGLDFVSHVDLISIFGNALDNALEAVRKLPEEKRIVFLKSSQFANTLLLRFSNPYAGELRRENGRLFTSKTNPEWHGIGLSSITKAVSRYHGSVDTQINERDRQFDLTILIPLPENEILN